MVKCLNWAEMEDRRQKGLCFNYDEPFIRSHQCKKLFWIDLMEEKTELAAEFETQDEE